MKTKASVSSKKQPIVVKDLTSKKNPQGGFTIKLTNNLGKTPAGPATDCNSTMQGVSTTR
jgi:hypothetical protein